MTGYWRGSVASRFALRYTQTVAEKVFVGSLPPLPECQHPQVSGAPMAVLDWPAPENAIDVCRCRENWKCPACGIGAWKFVCSCQGEVIDAA